MSENPQRRAVETYRARMAEPGIVRFEVQALKTDRDLIRALARKLAEAGPDASARAKRGGRPTCDPLSSRYQHHQQCRQAGGVPSIACLAGGAGAATQQPRHDIISATAAANDCIVATGNERDFAELAFVNPLSGARG